MMTDGQIKNVAQQFAWVNLNIHEFRDDFARAIEAAATEPLLARIAELERQLEEAHKSLHDAATSLNTISQLAGYKERGGENTFMDTFMDVRLYAKSRHKCAREAINSYYLEPHAKEAHEVLCAAMQKGQP